MLSVCNNHTAIYLLLFDDLFDLSNAQHRYANRPKDQQKSFVAKWKMKKWIKPKDELNETDNKMHTKTHFNVQYDAHNDLASVWLTNVFHQLLNR